MSAASVLIISLEFLLASTVIAADLEMHSGPLPIPEGKYGNAAGCSMAHGDQPEGQALLLTPREIDVPNAHCDILVWEKNPATDLLSVDCGNRKFLILPRTATEQWMIVIELVGDQTFSTYQLVRCGPE